MSEALELLPCPFCGGPPVRTGSPEGLCGVECNSSTQYCTANLDAIYGTEREAAAAWNRRAEPHPMTPEAAVLFYSALNLGSEGLDRVARQRGELVVRCGALKCKKILNVKSAKNAMGVGTGGVTWTFCPPCLKELFRTADWVQREDAAEACCEDARLDGLCCVEGAR